MNKALRNTLIATWIGMTGLGTWAQAKGPDSKPQFTVCVRNYAQESPDTVQEAEEIAQRVFERAGVETTWVDAVAYTQHASSNETLQFSCKSAQTLLYVNLIEQSRAKGVGLSSNALGLAPGNAQELDRNTVYIFDQVASRLVRDEKVASKPYVLGHAMAHEIGHILAHLEVHSHNGIMKAKWKETDFRAMLLGRLNFNSEQTPLIRAEVIRRTRKLAASQPTGNSP